MGQRDSAEWDGEITDCRNGWSLRLDSLAKLLEKQATAVSHVAG